MTSRRRIRVVGGGPGGLFFALLAKRSNPNAEIEIVEQNPEAVTYGFGVHFSGSAIEKLRPSAPDVLDAIIEGQGTRDRLEVVLDDEIVAMHGDAAYFNARHQLLATLERFVAKEGVEVKHGERLDVVGDQSDWDLIVGADGVNSAVREQFATVFAPQITLGSNWFAWYGTRRYFDPLTIVLLRRPEGVFMAHASGYSHQEGSNFLVEVGADTFDLVGLADLTDDASMRLCEGIFDDVLKGEPLRGNRSTWFRAKFVRCENWSHENVVLIGDALHTVHPSVGAGTRYAMRDAAYLVDALQEESWEVDAGLQRFVESRRPPAEGFQRAAARSIAWYDQLPVRPPTDATKFALEYIMRTGRVRYEEFRRRNLTLVRRYESLL